VGTVTGVGERVGLIGPCDPSGAEQDATSLSLLVPAIAEWSSSRRSEKSLMRQDLYVFDYDAGPADERPTGSGQTNFDQASLATMTMTTVPAPWNVSEHSSIDMSSRATDRVQARRRHTMQVRAGLGAMIALGMSALGTALAIALR